MKKLLFIPLVILGYLLFLALPWRVFSAEINQFESIAEVFSGKFCGDRPTKDQLLGTICYLLKKPTALMVQDSSNPPQILGFFTGEKYKIYSLDLERIIKISKSAKIINMGIGTLYYEKENCLNSDPQGIDSSAPYLEFENSRDVLADNGLIDGQDGVYYQIVQSTQPELKTLYFQRKDNGMDESYFCEPITDDYGNPISQEINVVRVTPLNEQEMILLQPFLHIQPPLVIKAK